MDHDSGCLQSVVRGVTWYYLTIRIHSYYNEIARLLFG